MPFTMTSKEVMQFLHIRSKVTLWNYEKAGKIRFVKVGKYKLYNRASIEALIAKV